VPPQLYSLTELQKEANKRFGFSAKKTLSIAQSLYEKHKCLSYPRTDARVLGSKSLDQATKLINDFRGKHAAYFEHIEPGRLSLKNKRVFDDSKLTDHHALIPLGAKGSLQGDEYKIYDLVLRRFIMVFSKNYDFEETKVVIRVADENFKAKGKRVVCLGWKALAGGDTDQRLPAVSVGERGRVKSLEVENKMTQPPPEYTEATLLQAMINPARMAKDKYKKIFRGEVGLGTQSTRAQIIETLLDRKYVQRKGKSLVALPKGLAIISTMKGLKISQALTCPDETAKWEIALEEISAGGGSLDEFIKNIRKFIVDCSGEWKAASIKQQARQVTDKKPTVGKCPLCKNSVIESPKSYSCERWREGCKFTIWKNIAGKKISATQAGKILARGKSDRLKGFKSKAGKRFAAQLVLKGPKIEFEFEQRENR